MIISRTPFRISFFGGGTDYPAWYRENGGEVLGTAIDKYCYITCRYLPPFFEHRYRIVYSKIENCNRLDEIEHPAAKAIINHLSMDRGVEVHHDGDLPARSGMGTSSAFTVGLLHALHALNGRICSKKQLATESIHIEQQVLRETVGSQDQVLAAHGGFNHVKFEKGGQFSVAPITISPDRIADLNDHLMLFYTGIRRTASDVAKTYVNDIGSRERQMRSLMENVSDGISILQGRDDLSRFGLLLDEAWKAKSSLGAGITNPEINDIYETAKSSGAIGGKLLGAGGGGFMVLFAPPFSQPKIQENLNHLLHVPFKFEPSGSQIIFLDHEEDYSNAEQDRANQPVLAFRESV